jgi:hypothetical protein
MSRRTRTHKLKPWWYYLAFILAAIFMPVCNGLYQTPSLKPFGWPAGIVAVVLIAGIAGVIHQANEDRRMARLATARELTALTPIEFERYVGLLFKKQGYRVKHSRLDLRVA